MGDAHVYSLRYVYDIPKIMPNLIFCIYRLLTEPTFSLKDLEDFEGTVYTKMKERGCQDNMIFKKMCIYSTIGHFRVMCSVFIPVIWGMEAVGG